MESRFRVRYPRLFGALAVTSALASCGFYPNPWSEPGDRPWDKVVKESVSVEIGMAAQGEMDYVGDRDFFRFEATEGEYYELDITLGTLQDYVLHVFDAVGTHLASYDTSAVSRLFWAPSTGPYYVPGPYYVEVTSTKTGTYTLTVSTSDIVDDHPNSADNATPVQIGVATQGELEYEGDSDFFTFEATEGQFYQLDVTLGTLEDSVLSLFDAEDIRLADDYGRSAAPRIGWYAPATGTYHVQVASFTTDIGTYTLTVAAL